MEIASIKDICLIERGSYREDSSTFIASLPQFPRDTRVLHLDYLYTPDERLELWRKQNEDSIKEVMILYAGYGVQDSKTIVESNGYTSFETAYTHIPSPENIQQVGIEISGFLTHTEGGTYPAVIFIDSISLMLQYVSLNTVVQFIQECFTLLKRSETGGRFYFTPTVHNKRTINTIQSLFSE